jgi:exonuclease III
MNSHAPSIVLRQVCGGNNEEDADKENESEEEVTTHDTMEDTEIGKRLFDKDFRETVQEHLEDISGEVAREAGDHPGWIGDSFQEQRQKGVGLRAITVNMAQKLGGEEEQDRFLDWIEKWDLDVTIVQEPMRELTTTAAKYFKKKVGARGWKVAATPADGKIAEGTLMIVRGDWQRVYKGTKPIKGAGFSEGRATRSEFKAAKLRPAPDSGGPPPPMEYVAIYNMYGYANRKDEAKYDAMRQAVIRDAHQWRKKHKFGTVLLGGDLNATICPHKDTDKSAAEVAKGAREKGADLLQAFMIESKLTDAWRECHPNTRRYTHVTKEGRGEGRRGEAQGEESEADEAAELEEETPLECQACGAGSECECNYPELRQEEAPQTEEEAEDRPEGEPRRTVARALDYWMVSSEISQHIGTRVGIMKDVPLGGDHLPVMIEVPVDCTHMREGVCSIWYPHKGEPQLKWVDKPEKQEEADAAAEKFSTAVAAKHELIAEGLPLDEYAKAIMQGIQEAAIETGAAVWETMQYPKRAATTVHREGWGHKLATWKDKLWAAIRSIE